MKLRQLCGLALMFIASTLAMRAQPDDISSPLSYAPQPFDVKHYDAVIDLTRAPALDMSGVCSIIVQWTQEAAPYFAFHLRSLTVDSVFIDGAPVFFAAIGDSTSATFHYRVTPNAAFAGFIDTVAVYYHGTMTDELGPSSWGGVGSADSVLYTMGVGFKNNYVSATQHWLPCYDHPSDKATFRGIFKTLNGNITVSNGTLDVATHGDTNIYEWQTEHLTATYLLTFATSRYLGLDFGNDPVPMVVYARAADTAMTRKSFKLLPRMVSTFATRLTPYPFEKVGFVNTPIGAMEHQTMVSYPTSLSRRGDTVNTIAAHEIAHQWFGDLVTPTDFRHVWLTESFATYCESLWFEELGGTLPYLQSLGRAMNTYLNEVSTQEGILPLYDFPRESPSSNYPETIYRKGAVVVGMLRTRMGDSSFFAALREYLSTYAYANATTEQLRTIVERHAGESLDWFFDQWVYARGWPRLSMDFDRSPLGGGYSRVVLQVAQTSAGDSRVYRNLPIELLFLRGGDTTVRIVHLDAASQSFTLDSVRDYTSVVVNRGPTLRTLFSVDAVSGVEGFAANADSAVSFFVKPNPTDGSAALTVQVRGVTECPGVRYELYDSSGQRLGTGASEICEFTIPTEGIASGAYVLRFRFRDVFHDVSIVIAR